MAKVSKENIKAAVEMLDSADDALWEKDGSPSLEALRALTGNSKLTSDDVDEAVGAFKRPGGNTVGSNQGNPESKQDNEEVAVTANPEPEPARDRPKQAPDPRDPLEAKNIVADAEQDLNVVRAEIEEVEALRNECNERLVKLNARKSHDLRQIEIYAPRISQADAVKAIQRQTQERLIQQKSAAITSAEALRAAGIGKTYPSVLDSHLANRRRTPEQTANYAKYVHQNAALKPNGVN